VKRLREASLWRLGDLSPHVVMTTYASDFCGCFVWGSEFRGTSSKSKGGHTFQGFIILCIKYQVLLRFSYLSVIQYSRVLCV